VHIIFNNNSLAIVSAVTIKKHLFNYYVYKSATIKCKCVLKCLEEKGLFILKLPPQKIKRGRHSDIFVDFFHNLKEKCL